MLQLLTGPFVQHLYQNISINIPAVWFQQHSNGLWVLHCFRGFRPKCCMSIHGMSCWSNLQTRTSLSANYNKYTEVYGGDIAAGNDKSLWHYWHIVQQQQHLVSNIWGLQTINTTSNIYSQMLSICAVVQCDKGGTWVKKIFPFNDI